MSATSSHAVSSRAMLISLSISQWSGRRLDKAITEELNQQHGAESDASRVNKLLLPKQALDPIQRIVSETRTAFYQRTLPWMDNGSRIMAAGAYLDHMAWVRGQAAKYETAIDDLIRSYPAYVADAQRRMGQLFKSEDYPRAEDLRAKFSLNCSVLPVPSADDFRVEMGDEQAAQIRKDIEEQVMAATKTAVDDAYRRVIDAVSRMVERLNAYRPATRKGDRSEGIFKDTLVENIRDLIDTLPALNITGDPNLTATAADLRALVKHDAQTLRDDATVRRNVATEAQRILDSVSDFLA